MAQLFFLDPSNALDYSASGLGFFGSSFGGSVLVGAFQNTTFVTDGNGSVNIAQTNNVTYLNTGSGIVSSSTSGIAVTCIPNFQATTNIRFTNSSAVKTQNAQLRIYDRSNINNPASGVTVKVYECIHPTIAQSNNGSGANAWSPTSSNPQTGTLTVGGSGSTVSMVASPGVSGLRPNGAGTTATQHDWYACISASPDSVGSKTQFGLYFSLEYL